MQAVLDKRNPVLSKALAASCLGLPHLHPLHAPAQGTLAALDTRNPLLYIDFPGGGRLKLLGTLCYPANRYMVLRPGRASAVLCEDVFESMVRSPSPLPRPAGCSGAGMYLPTLHGWRACVARAQPMVAVGGQTRR
jgi:hypothetical protein